MLQLDILRSQEIIFSLDFVDRHHKSLLRSAQVSEHPISLRVAQNVSIPPIAGILIKKKCLALLICENYFVYVCVEQWLGRRGSAEMVLLFVCSLFPITCKYQELITKVKIRRNEC